MNTKYILSENFDVFNSQDDIFGIYCKKGKFSFYFILFKRFMVNQLTTLQAKSQ